MSERGIKAAKGLDSLARGTLATRACLAFLAAPTALAVLSCSAGDTASTPQQESEPDEASAALNTTPRPPWLTGRVRIPRDWKQLPVAVDAWTQDILYRGGITSAGGDTVVVSRNGYSAINSQGNARWSAPLPPGHAAAIAGCGGVVALMRDRSIEGVDASTGTPRWSVSFEGLERPGYGTPDPVLVGCDLIVKLRPKESDDERRSAIIIAVDTRRGRKRTLATCEERECRLETLARDGALVLRDGDAAYRLSNQEPGKTPLTAGTTQIAGDASHEIHIRRGETDARGESPWEAFDQGRSSRWRALLGEVYGRIGDDIVALRPTNFSLVRWDLASGETRWSLPLDEDLYARLAEEGAAGMNDSDLFVVTRAWPRVLLHVDLEGGQVESLRLLAHADSIRVEVGDEFTIIGMPMYAVALHRDRVEPPPRASIPLSDDIERALSLLRSGGQQQEEAPFHVPFHQYPFGHIDALHFLSHLGEVSLPHVAETVREGSPAAAERALRAAAAMRGVDPRSVFHEAFERALSQTGPRAGRSEPSCSPTPRGFIQSALFPAHSPPAWGEPPRTAFERPTRVAGFARVTGDDARAPALPSIVRTRPLSSGPSRRSAASSPAPQRTQAP